MQHFNAAQSYTAGRLVQCGTEGHGHGACLDLFRRVTFDFLTI